VHTNEHPYILQSHYLWSVRSHDASSPAIASSKQSDRHAPLEWQDRDNCHSEIWENEPGSEPGPGTSGSTQQPATLDDDSLVNVEDGIRRHDELTRWRASGTQQDYRQHIRAFARRVDLENLTRGRLKSKGHDLIVDFILSMPASEQQVVLCALKSFWTIYLRLDWPILNKRDFGNTLGKFGSRHTPRDDQVKPWIEALEKEPDSYIQSKILCIAECGWRRNHIKKLFWEDVKFDPTGRCLYVIADGKKRGFKTHSGIIAWLPPNAKEALTKWYNESPCNAPDSRIWPNRSFKGRYEPKRELTDHSFDRIWHDFMGRWKMPTNSRFTSAYFRHFVSTACRKHGLSGPPKAALCGHGFHADRQVFTDTYDNPGESEILEEQQARMPHGRLWFLKESSLQVVGEVPDELVAIWKDLKEGRITPSQCLPGIERILYRVRAEEAKALEL